MAMIVALIPATAWAAVSWRGYSEVTQLSVRQSNNHGCIKLANGETGWLNLNTTGGQAAFRMAQAAQLANKTINLNLDPTDNSGGCNYGGVADQILDIRVQ